MYDMEISIILFYLFIYLFIYLSIYLFIYLCIAISAADILKMALEGPYSPNLSWLTMSFSLLTLLFFTNTNRIFRKCVFRCVYIGTSCFKIVKNAKQTNIIATISGFNWKPS